MRWLACCVNVFYEPHDTNYNYPRIGKVDNPEDLAKMAGRRSVGVRFE